MSDHEELFELAELYGAGGLTRRARALEQHVADGCAGCEAAVLRANLDVLSFCSPVAPCRAAAGACLRAPARALRLRSRRRRRAPARIASRAAARGADPSRPPRACCSCFGLGGLGLLGVRQRARTRSARGLEEGPRTRRASPGLVPRPSRGAAARRPGAALAGLDGSSRALEAPLARSLALRRPGRVSPSAAKAYLEPESGRLILYAHNLPPVPDGRTYQIWVIVADQPRSASGSAMKTSGAL
jgi:hypothetical protein